jgi:zinc transport system ATP-binding protein
MATPALSVTDLVVTLGDHTVLDGITFEASAGDFVAVIGPNGAGKTTLIRVLLGLTASDGGVVRIFGRRPSRADAGVVGYVPQVKTLDRSFPAPASDLVLTALHQRWPGRVSREERRQAVEALDAVGAAHLADQSLGTLSGGELQRVYLARSFIRSPRLILLDEPATGVDISGAADLYELLETYQADHDATIVMVTHDWTAAYHHATHVLLMDGAPIGYGPPEEALSEDCLRRAFGHIGHAHAMFGGAP